MKPIGHFQRGFTLIELVVVIIILGILSVYAASRYTGSTDFSVYAAQEQAIAIIRQIQLGRMQSNIDPADTSLSDEYTLSVTNNCLGSVASCGDTSRSNNLVLLSTDDIAFTTPMTVDFDLLGAPTSGADITITMESGGFSLGVCINSQGYVHACD